MTGSRASMGRGARFAAGIVLAAAVAAGATGDGSGAAHANASPPGYALEMRVPSQPVVIHYNEGDARVARRVAEICDERLDGLAREVGLAAVPPTEIEVAGDAARYRRRYGGRVPEWGVAFAVMGEGRMVVDVARATRAWNSLETVIPHEFSHLLVAARLGGTPTPVWFLEGLAQWQAGEWSLVDNWQLMSAVWSHRAPRLWQLQSSYPVSEDDARTAYRVSYVAFTRLFEERTDVPAFLDEVARRGSFDEGFGAFFGESPAKFYARFDEWLGARYRSHLMIFQTGPLFSLLAAVFLLVGLRFYLRKRRRIREMPDETGGGG